MIVKRGWSGFPVRRAILALALALILCDRSIMCMETRRESLHVAYIHCYNVLAQYVFDNEDTDE